VDGVAGVMGEYVSNGLWRVRVQEVREAKNPFMGRGRGFAVVLELRNLQERSISPSMSGMQLQLIDVNGKALAFGSRSFSDLHTQVPQAGVITNTIVFGDPASATSEIGDADKLLIQFKDRGATVRPKAIRINLRERK
jgi:hypothetical protein